MSMTPIPYFEQCDRMRSHFSSGEDVWQQMISSREPVSTETALDILDAGSLLNDNETFEQWCEYYAESAPFETGWYRSIVNDVTIYFFQTAGFEYIFISEVGREQLGLEEIDSGPRLTR